MSDAVFSTVALALLIGAGVLGGFTAPPSFTPGDRVTYVETSGDRTCGVLSSVHEGNGWILPDRSKFRYAVRPMSEITWGCDAA